MTSSSQFHSLALSSLMDRFKEPCPEGEEFATDYFQEIADAIQTKGELGVGFLKERLPTADAHQTRAILFALSRNKLGDPAIPQILLSYLHDPHPLVVAEAIDALRRKSMKGPLSEVFSLSTHPSPYVRGSILRYISGVVPDRALPMLLDALDDPHFIVRENAVDELSDLEVVDAIPRLRKLLEDPHPDVRQAAEHAIKFLGEIQKQR